MKLPINISKKDLIISAELSKVAYSGAHWYKGNAIKIFTKKTSTAIVCEVDGTIFVNFQGTRPTILDWLKNLMIKVVRFCGIGSHGGFVSELDLVIGNILAYLEIINPDGGKPVIPGGHSQGSAVGGDFCILLDHKGLRLDWAVLLACPRHVDAESAEYLDATIGHKILRIDNQSDVVTHVPPESLGWGHYGKGIFFDENDFCHIGTPSPMEYRISMLRLAKSFRLNEMWNDHDASDYILKLKNLDID